MITEIPLSIINIPDFLTETIDNHTNALDQKINTTNDQIQGIFTKFNLGNKRSEA